MTDPSLGLQIAIRSRLISDSAVTDIVPAQSIFDGTTRPANFPCVIIGDGQTVRETVSINRDYVRVFADLHVWTKGTGLEAVKTLSGAVWQAMRRPLAIDGLVSFHVQGTRYLRDPGDYGHSIITCDALIRLEQVAA